MNLKADQNRWKNCCCCGFCALTRAMYSSERAMASGIGGGVGRAAPWKEKKM